MADIEISCASCSKTLKISQFVDKSALVCPYCKNKVQPDAAPPEPAPETKGKGSFFSGERRLKLKEMEAKPTTLFKSPEQLAEEAAAAKKAKKDRKGGAPEEEPKKPGDVCTAEVKEHEQRVEVFSHHRISWLIFITLAGLAYFARYGAGGLYAPQIKAYADYCAWAIVAMNVVIIAVSAKDSIFQSVLGLLIPGYSFYWLFLVSDNFYLRAIFGGILIAIGQDGGLVIQEVLAGWFKTVNSFISSGGG